MPYHPTPTDAPFALTTEESKWLYIDGAQVPIVARSRRRVVVDAFGTRCRLCRRRLERDGVDTTNGLEFRVTRYQLPDEAA